MPLLAGCVVLLTILIAGIPAVNAGAESHATERLNERGIQLTLSLADAIGQALHNNVMLRLARERIEEIKGGRLKDDSDLLPHVALSGAQSRVRWQNLTALGFTDFGVIGPYNSFDARASLVQRVFDLSAFSKWQAANLDVKISRLQESLAQQQVITAAVLAYLDALCADQRLKAVEEDIRLAGQFLSMAEHQLKAGTVTRLDVVRAKTRLAGENARQQQIIRARYAAYIRLQRVINVPLGSEIALNDAMTFFDEAVPLPAEAVSVALTARVEMDIADAGVDLKKRKLAQAQNERWPQVTLAGNYGRAGETYHKSIHDVAEIGIRVSMPVFEGGRIEGQIWQDQSRQRQQEILRADLATQVEEDVRLAVQTLISMKAEVKAADEALGLALQEVALVRDQYAAGVTNHMAVTDSQATLERAREAYVSALAQYHMARVNYFSALGKTGSFRLNS